MPTFRSGRITEILTRSRNRLVLNVDVDGEVERAIAFPMLTGSVEVGDTVVLNTTAVDLGLGTGDHHFVLWKVGLSGLDTSEGEDPGPGGSSRGRKGHIMKLRYTPLQHYVLSVEEAGSPYHEVFTEVRQLDGMPVIACALHSHVEPAAAVLRCFWEGGRPLRVCYVMTDGAALPIALSETVDRMKAAGLIQTTITVGNAFGGDFEAVSIHSALVAARHVAEADVTIVGMGPGITGTASVLGFSGLEQGWISDAAAALGGRSVFVPRISSADPRARHYGLSHHTLTCISLAVHRPTVLALPAAGVPLDDTLRSQLAGTHLPAGVDVRWVDSAVERTRRALDDLLLEPKSMGRKFDDDPIFFASAGAAAITAIQELSADTEGTVIAK